METELFIKSRGTVASLTSMWNSIAANNDHIVIPPKSTTKPKLIKQVATIDVNNSTTDKPIMVKNDQSNVSISLKTDHLTVPSHPIMPEQSIQMFVKKGQVYEDNIIRPSFIREVSRKILKSDNIVREVIHEPKAVEQEMKIISTLTHEEDNPVAKDDDNAVVMTQEETPPSPSDQFLRQPAQSAELIRQIFKIKSIDKKPVEVDNETSRLPDHGKQHQKPAIHVWNVTRAVFRSGLVLSSTRRASDSVIPMMKTHLLIGDKARRQRQKLSQLGNSFEEPLPFETFVNYLSYSPEKSNGINTLEQENTMHQILKRSTSAMDPVSISDSIKNYEIIMRNLRNYEKFCLVYNVTKRDEKENNRESSDEGEEINVEKLYQSFSHIKHWNLFNNGKKFNTIHVQLPEKINKDRSEENNTESQSLSINNNVNDKTEKKHTRIKSKSLANIYSGSTVKDLIMNDNNNNTPTTTNLKRTANVSSQTDISICGKNADDSVLQATSVTSTTAAEEKAIHALDEVLTQYSSPPTPDVTVIVAGDVPSVNEQHLTTPTIDTTENNVTTQNFERKQSTASNRDITVINNQVNKREDYACSMTKFDRQGYKQRPRLLFLTNERVYNLTTKGSCKEMLTFAQIKGSVSEGHIQIRSAEVQHIDSDGKQNLYIILIQDREYQLKNLSKKFFNYLLPREIILDETDRKTQCAYFVSMEELLAQILNKKDTLSAIVQNVNEQNQRTTSDDDLMYSLRDDAYYTWNMSCVNYYNMLMMNNFLQQLPAITNACVLAAVADAAVQTSHNIRQRSDPLVEIRNSRLVLASIYRRFFAEVIDFILLHAFKLLVVTIIANAFHLIDENRLTLSYMVSSLLYDDTLSIPFELIFLEIGYAITSIAFEGICLAKYGCTPGKRLLRLRVIRCNSMQIQDDGSVLVEPGLLLSYISALTRSAFKSLMSTFLFPAVLVALLSAHRQTSYDIASNALVVELEKWESPEEQRLAANRVVRNN
ncbi:unnamed protein product [Didymodactylos carnosus]|uniref:RDD domain-containing protein n=1 Tax=Didymodactylos carnosus TaxID=1234261 RepID=A0A813TGW3_9BILA|nr:unnamed protein product [Didymodactylos carnosus]CAF0812458.1 unnamed protein product [Didymodactylos carnosus]CAF3500171.1 unnamed protein product [Didymodactylos carnosus]CAF3598203.1 unnamed protein product [Didymodactylos carnosus]